jgi:ankyrin repeat protein
MLKELADLVETAKESEDLAKLKNAIRNVSSGEEDFSKLKVSDSSGNTLLHRAASVGNHEICEYFIQSGCSINAVNNLGQTALHAAATNNRDRIIKLLLEKVK